MKPLSSTSMNDNKKNTASNTSSMIKRFINAARIFGAAFLLLLTAFHSMKMADSEMKVAISI